MLIAGSNRTFMELKFEIEIKDVDAQIGSNRTFMELKCRSMDYWLRHD